MLRLPGDWNVPCVRVRTWVSRHPPTVKVTIWLFPCIVQHSPTGAPFREPHATPGFIFGGTDPSPPRSETLARRSPRPPPFRAPPSPPAGTVRKVRAFPPPGGGGPSCSPVSSKPPFFWSAEGRTPRGVGMKGPAPCPRPSGPAPHPARSRHLAPPAPPPEVLSPSFWCMLVYLFFAGGGGGLRVHFIHAFPTFNISTVSTPPLVPQWRGGLTITFGEYTPVRPPAFRQVCLSSRLPPPLQLYQ